MPVNFVNPYSGEPEQTCSVSFGAQTQLADAVGKPLTEAEFGKGKLLGEWGVIKAKLAKKEIPDGTKVLSYENEALGSRGFLFIKNGELWKTTYHPKLGRNVSPTKAKQGELFINSGIYKVSIPQAVAPANQQKPEAVDVTPDYITKIALADVKKFKDGQVFAVKATGEFVRWNAKDSGFFEHVVTDPSGYGNVVQKEFVFFNDEVKSGQGWLVPDGSSTTPSATAKKVAPPPTNLTAPIASPTPAPPVQSGSTSPGSMSHEDVAAMFVKIKDDLAKEKGLNIKGANAALDEEVYKAIGGATGYTPVEVKAKIDAYKAAGNKLSALKKKVLAGTYKVPEGKAVPAKQSAPNSPLAKPTTKAKAPDPKPHGVPTVATPKLTEAIKVEVKQAVEAKPAKVYSDEDVASAYIIAKDAIVANNTKGWTLYTKNDEFDLEIAVQVGLKTGLNPAQQKAAIASYLASGKKLSTLKKQLAKQGAFTPQADSLKKSGTAKTAAEKKAEVDAKADAGYTPTPTITTPAKPATKANPSGSPAVDTAKPPPKAAEKDYLGSGDPSWMMDHNKSSIFTSFKLDQGNKAWLSGSAIDNYEAILNTYEKFKDFAWVDKSFSLLQVLRVVDEEGAKKAGVANGHLFEKKIVEWLTTPAGTQAIKDLEQKKAKEAVAKAAKEAKTKAEAEAAKKLMANQPPLPADSASFQEMTPTKALRFQERMLAAKPFGSGEKTGLRHYTGDAYIEMNSYLRGQSTSIGTTSKRAIDQSSRGMRPSPEPMLLRRGTGFIQFGSDVNANTIWGITGKTFEDKGFLSTSAAGKAAFGGQVAMEIEAPAGTPGMWVDNFSKHPGENEWLLDKGTKMKVLNVRKEGNTFVVRLRVVND